MTNLPPSRTADRIIIRLPDGMRDRLHARAEANGRSMTAEVVHMLRKGLGDPEKSDVKELIDMGVSLGYEIKAAEQDMKAKQVRMNYVHDTLREIFGEAIGDEDPVRYAMLETHRRWEEDLRKAEQEDKDQFFSDLAKARRDGATKEEAMEIALDMARNRWSGGNGSNTGMERDNVADADPAGAPQLKGIKTVKRPNPLRSGKRALKLDGE